MTMGKRKAEHMCVKYFIAEIGLDVTLTLIMKLHLSQSFAN